MITVDQIKKLAKEKLQDSENFLVDVSVKPGNKIVVLLDNEKGVTIDDCVQMSRHIEFSLDREKEDFELSVSSPGADSAFKVLKQYHKHLGKQVQVTTTDGDKVTGTLKSVNDKSFEVEVAPSKKKGAKKTDANSEANNIKKFEYNQVKETKGVISFK